LPVIQFTVKKDKKQKRIIGSVFEDLEVWKKLCGLSIRFYGLLRDCRDYGMKDQMIQSLYRDHWENREL